MNQTSKRVVEAITKFNEAGQEVQAVLLSDDVFMGRVILPRMVSDLCEAINQTLIVGTPILTAYARVILTAYARVEGIEIPETDSRLESTE